MPKYTVEDLDPRNWENQMERDITEDADKAKDTLAIEWTDPTKGLFGGSIQEGRTIAKRVDEVANTEFDHYWSEKMRQQKAHKK